MATRNPLNLACIGCGARAQTYTELAARRPDLYRVVAGADPLPERVEKVRRLSGESAFPHSAVPMRCWQPVSSRTS